MKKVVVIGAGISGLFFANLLCKDPRYEVVIYEKNNSVNFESGYGIQLSVNSVKLLNEIGFKNINSKEKFHPNKLDLYSLKNNKKICDLDISIFNNDDLKYTTIKRSTLVKFLKEKVPDSLINYNKKVVKVHEGLEKIKINFQDNSLVECDYLVISDGVFSSTKSAIANKEIKPEYFNSIALRATVEKKIIENVNQNNISLFLGSNLHSVIYPIDQSNKFNFVGILRKKLTFKEINNYSLFKEKTFISSIISKISEQIHPMILSNLENIKCFPIFVSKEIYSIKKKNVFLIGDAFFAYPPSFAQGASQSIEIAYELYQNLENDKNQFNNQRIIRTKMINNKSKFNYFAFHLSNPLIIFIRNLMIKYLFKNKRFIKNYLGKIYNY